MFLYITKLYARNNIFKHMKSFLILGRSIPHEYVVLSSATLQISDFSTKKKTSLMNVLNNSGPNIEF